MRICIFCKHWSYDPGQPHYSEYTPGEESYIDCSKGQYPGLFYRPESEKEYREAITKAETCEFYEEE